MLIQMASGLVHIDGLVIDNANDAKAAVRVLVQFLAEKGIEATVNDGYVSFKETIGLTPSSDATKVRIDR